MLTLISIILLTILIAYKAKEDITIAMPVSVAAHIMLALILGLVRGLAWMGLLSLVISLLGLIVLAPRDGSGCKSYVRELAGILLNPRYIYILLLLAAVAVLTRDHIAVWWDDINFWSTDAKAIYYLKGFPGRYGNAAPEFGDYPPGIQLFKYFFLSLMPYYREGLDFAGFYCFNIIFLLPLWGLLKDKRLYIQLPALLILLMMPGIVSSIWSMGTCADLGASTVYCALLIMILEGERIQTELYLWGTGLLASLLLLCKNTGFQWVIFAFILMLFLHFTSRSMAKVRLLIPLAVAAACAAIWWSFCLINRRVAKLTVNGVRIVAGRSINIRDVAQEKSGLFFKGLIFCPLHTDKTWLLDISFIAVFILSIALILLLARLGRISVYMGRTISLYMIVTGIISVGLVYYAHLTIFANETQYSTPEIMTISISRYCLPYTLSTLVIIAYLAIRYCNSGKVLIIAGLIVMLTTDYTAYAQALGDYRLSLAEDYEAREAMLRPSARAYAARVAEDQSLAGKRVLYLRSEEDNRWVENTYLNREVSPVATVYGSYNSDNLTEDIIRQASELHAHYVYVDSTGFEGKADELPMELDSILYIKDTGEEIIFGTVLPTASYLLN